MAIRAVHIIDKFILLFNPAELFTTVAFNTHCASKSRKELFKNTEIWAIS